MNHSQTEAPQRFPPATAMVARLRAQGLAGPAATLLDAFAPLAPLGAQALYIAQPLAGLARAGWGGALGDLAAALEAPGGVVALRAALLAPADPHDG